MNIWHENTETPRKNSWCHIVFKRPNSDHTLLKVQFSDDKFRWWFNRSQEVKLEDVKKWAYSDELIESIFKGGKK